MDAYTLDSFSENSIVKNVITGKEYNITQHYKGSCNLNQVGTTKNEHWLYSNGLFKLVAQPIDISIVCLIEK